MTLDTTQFCYIGSEIRWVSALIAGLRAVTSLPRGAVRERLARRRLKKIRVFPSNGTGKLSRLCTAGWERDGKAGRRLTGWDGNGREIKRSRETSRETGWETSRETSWETSRKTRLHVGRHRNRFVAFITTAVFHAPFFVCVTQESKVTPTRAVHVYVYIYNLPKPLFLYVSMVLLSTVVLYS